MKRFTHSLGVRHLVCGSCNGCEHEMNALAGPDYDLTRFGFEIVASPRHADAITVTGAMTEAMREPARETIEAAPHPRVIVAIGDCAIGSGVWCENGSGAGTELGAGESIEVRGCPPTPQAILAGLTQAAERLG